MNKDDTICYTGIGSVKKGNHTRKKFIEVMNKNFKKECSVHIKSLKCKSCKKSKEMNSKEINKQLNAHLKNKTYKMTKNTENKIVKQMNQCKKCKLKNFISILHSSVFQHRYYRRYKFHQYKFQSINQSI